jgi:hypothetical protein
MVVSSVGLRPKGDCSGKAQNQLYKYITDPSSRQRGCHTSRNPQSSDRETKIWSWAPDGSPTPKQTGRLTVGRNVTSTSTSAVRIVTLQALYLVLLCRGATQHSLLELNLSEPSGEGGCTYCVGPIRKS